MVNGSHVGKVWPKVIQASKEWSRGVKGGQVGSRLVKDRLCYEVNEG